MTKIELPDLLSVIAGPRTDPGPLISELREHDPVCWIPGLDAWIVTRHEDVRGLCVDPRVSADAIHHEGYQAPKDPKAAKWLGAIPFRATLADPESLGRRLVHRTLTPRAIQRERHQIEEVVEEFAAPLRSRKDVVDLASEFTRPVSVTAIGRLLGIPRQGEANDRFHKLPRAARNIKPFLTPKKREEAEQGGVEVCEFVLELVQNREILDEGIITDLLDAAHGNERVSDDDVVAVVAGLIATGQSTPGNGGARGLMLLLERPELLEELRGNRELLPNAIEELVRYDSGLVAMARYVLEDFELRGQTLKKGQLVILSLTGANRDPRVFEDPETIDLHRDNRASMAFGHGPHYCLGINAARAELHLMFDAALDFLPPNARLLEDQIRWSSKGLMSKVKCLPVDFGG
jgi:cytochrome P450